MKANPSKRNVFLSNALRKEISFSSTSAELDVSMNITSLLYLQSELLLKYKNRVDYSFSIFNNLSFSILKRKMKLDLCDDL